MFFRKSLIVLPLISLIMLGVSLGISSCQPEKALISGSFLENQSDRYLLQETFHSINNNHFVIKKEHSAITSNVVLRSVRRQETPESDTPILLNMTDNAMDFKSMSFFNVYNSLITLECREWGKIWQIEKNNITSIHPNLAPTAARPIGKFFIVWHSSKKETFKNIAYHPRAIVFKMDPTNYSIGGTLRLIPEVKADSEIIHVYRNNDLVGMFSPLGQDPLPKFEGYILSKLEVREREDVFFMYLYGLSILRFMSQLNSQDIRPTQNIPIWQTKRNFIGFPRQEKWNPSIPMP